MYRDNLEHKDAMTDQDIDYSDIPPLTAAQLALLKPLREVLPQAVPSKVRITIRLDADTIQWFKEQVQQAGRENPSKLFYARLSARNSAS